MIKQLKDLYEKFFSRGSFARNFGITFSGNASVFLIQILLSPIISRIYAPSEYGTYALFTAIVTNVSIFGSLRYAQSVVIAKDDIERFNLSILSIGLSLAISILILGLIAVFKNSFLIFFKAQELDNQIYLVPFAMFLTILIEVFVSLNTHKKKFSTNVVAGFVNNLTSRLLNIIYGLVAGSKAVGLILGDLSGKIFCLSTLSSSLFSRQSNISTLLVHTNFKSIKTVAAKYKSFPLYYLPSNLITIFSGQLPIYFLQWRFTSASVGIFALATSMLEIFNRIVPYALSPVFLQKADELKNESLEYLADRTFRLYALLLILGSCIFSLVAIVGEELFQFVFGSDWRLAGTFASLMTMQYIYGFVAIPLSEVYTILGKQRLLFLNSLLNLMLRGISIIIVVYLNVDEVNAIFTFGVAGGIGNVILIFGVFAMLRFNWSKALFYLLLSIIVISIIFLFKGF